MSDEMTPEKAMKVVEELSGNEGIMALEKELVKAISNKKTQLAIIQGEINGFNVVLRIISALRKRCGLGDISNNIVNNELKEKQPETISDEVKKRIMKGLCSYKEYVGNGGANKWCVRKLRSKLEKKEGYCKTHLNELGLLSEKA